MYAAPPPRRVREGRFGANSLVVETSAGRIEVPYTSVRCVFVGRIQPDGGHGESWSSTSPTSFGAITMVGRVVRRDSGSADDATAAAASMSSSPWSALDIHVDGDPAPLRIETAGTNMRSFLGEEAGYSGDINFLALLRHLAEVAPHALHASVQEVLAKGRHAMKSYTTRDDFYLASRDALRKMGTGERVAASAPAPVAPAPQVPAPRVEPVRQTPWPLPEVEVSTGTWEGDLPPAFATLTPSPTFAPPPSPTFAPPPSPTFAPPLTTTFAPPPRPLAPPAASPQPGVKRDMFGEMRAAEGNPPRANMLTWIAIAIVVVGIAYDYLTH